MTTGCRPFRSSSAELQPSHSSWPRISISRHGDLFRKGQEAILTVFLERTLTKRRILELYLNVIEWGDGIYGAEAAAQHYFHKPALVSGRKRGGLSVGDDSQPANRLQSAVNPRRVARRQRIIQRGMPIREAAWLTRHCDCATLRRNGRRATSHPLRLGNYPSLLLSS